MSFEPSGPADLLVNPRDFCARLRSEVPTLPADAAVPSLLLDCGLGSAVANAFESRHRREPGARSLLEVLVAGCPSMHRNFGQALQTDITRRSAALLPSVVLPPERRMSEWIGGSIIADLSTTQGCFVTHAHAEEHGYDYLARNFALPSFGDHE
jgi:hypothetical protein